MPDIHIIGAGLAGLACAVALAKRGKRAIVHEAAGQAGGRCRSFYDDALGCLIDNGNHLMMSGNWAVMDYLGEIGARDTLISPPRAAIPFVDLKTGERWTVRPNAGPFPFWIFMKSRRVPGSRPGHYLQALGLWRANAQDSVADCFDTSLPLYRRLWEPLAVAALNTAAEEGAARLLWPIVFETLGRGEARARPCIAREGLSHSLVDPAIAYLEARGTEIRFGQRLRQIETTSDRVTELVIGRKSLAIGRNDRVVLATPPPAAKSLLPEIKAPTGSRAILNAHFRLDTPVQAGDTPLLGVIGGTAQWLFLRKRIVSVTISAADALIPLPVGKLAPRIWADVIKALDLGDAPMPPHRIVKEKRATFAQTPDEVAQRPKTASAYHNLFLAGDWTDTGLPATIEGAVRSGRKAADAVMA